MSDLWAALRKDLLLQWRGRAQLVAIFAFGASALLGKAILKIINIFKFK